MKLRDLFTKRSVAEQAVEDARRRRAQASPSRRLADVAGRAQRAPQRSHDLVLGRHAQAWMAALPSAVRPHELCTRYPRLANRVALCWNDVALTEQVFDDLLLDRRGGRVGFPAPVASELLRLRLFHAKQRKGSTRSALWEADSIAVSDR